MQGLVRGVQQRSSAISTICGDRVRTFAQTAELVARLASALREAGVRRGDRVAIQRLLSPSRLRPVTMTSSIGAPKEPRCSFRVRQITRIAESTHYDTRVDIGHNLRIPQDLICE